MLRIRPTVLILEDGQKITALEELADHEKALDGVEGVLEDVDDRHDVLVLTGEPMELHLTTRLRTVAQYLERIFGVVLLRETSHHFATFSDAEDL